MRSELQRCEHGTEMLERAETHVITSNAARGDRTLDRHDDTTGGRGV